MMVDSHHGSTGFVPGWLLLHMIDFDVEEFKVFETGGCQEVTSRV
jgi:hypothetical protein